MKKRRGGTCLGRHEGEISYCDQTIVAFGNAPTKLEPSIGSRDEVGDMVETEIKILISFCLNPNLKNSRPGDPDKGNGNVVGNHSGISIMTTVKASI